MNKNDEGASGYPGEPPNPLPVLPNPPGFAQRHGGPGLRLTFTRIPGLTKRTLLQHPYYFQCPPLDTFSRSGQFSHTDYDSLRTGQFSRPGSMQLRSFSFNTVHIDWGAPWTLLNKLPLNADEDETRFVSSNFPTPLEAAYALEGLLESGTPFYFSAASPLLWHLPEIPHGRLPVTMRTLEVEERAGEVDARYFNINLVEFRRPVISAQAKGKGQRGRQGGSDRLPVSFFARNLPANRDTMHELAKFYYGSASKWRVIAKANGFTRLAGSVNLKAYFAKQRSRKITVPALPSYD
jgi:hypothetical protein